MSHERAIPIVVAALLSACARGPAVPQSDGGALHPFANDASLGDFFAEVARTRTPLHVAFQYVEGRRHVHASDRGLYGSFNYVTALTGPSVDPAKGAVVSGSAVWLRGQRGVVRILSREGMLVADPSACGEDVRQDALLAVDGGVVTVGANDCGGSTLTRCASADHPGNTSRLRLCGELRGGPWVARAGDQILVYAMFEGVSETFERDTLDVHTKVRLPTAQAANDVAMRSILTIGPVYYPVRREADVVLRALFRCEATLQRCSVQGFVAPRSTIDALWVDEQQVALALAGSERNGFVYIVPSTGRPPHAVEVSAWPFGVASVGDGRFALLASRERMHFPNERAEPTVIAIDPNGRVSNAVTLPAAVSARTKDGQWSWAVSKNRFAYGPARYNRSGGAEGSHTFVAALPEGRVEARAVESSVDAVRFVGDDIVFAGASERRVKTVERCPIASPTKCVTRSYGADAERFELDDAKLTTIVELGRRRFVVVPQSRTSKPEENSARIFELVPDGFRDWGVVPLAGDYERDWAALAFDGRLLLASPTEAVVVDFPPDGLRVISRVRH